MDYLRILFTCVASIHLALLWSSATEAGHLNDYILDYQPLTFNPSHLHERHDRVRRSVDPYLRWNFKAYGRTFNIRLSPATSLFTSDFRLDFGNGEEEVDTSFIYQGVLTDNPDSHVHMSILNDSILGFIDIPGHNIYHIEPAYKHIDNPTFPSIIYPESRMNMDPYRHKRYAAARENAACGSESLFEKLRKKAEPTSKRYRKKREGNSERFPHNKYSAYYNTDSLSRKRRSLQTNKRSCFLHLRSDVLLFNHIKDSQGTPEKTKDEILAMFAIHVGAIARIYENTNFDLMNNPSVSFQGVTFQLQKSTIMKNCDNVDNHYCTDNMDVSNFLDLTSNEDHSAFCLVHTFTYRDFIGGTLGLAWVATPSSPNAGVCGEYGNTQDGKRSLNTGITTLINFKKSVPSRVSQLTFAHEVGHNFGSQHDTTDQCAPYGTNLPGNQEGNFIMFPSANTGNLANNDKFSMCSRDYIAQVLQAMTDSNNPRVYCFQASDASFCGNNVVEEGEECDCGYSNDCDDQCCNARQEDGTNPLTMCTRKSASVCSPSQGKCCTAVCSYEPSTVQCQGDTECSHAVNCLGTNASCPTPNPKPEMTFCNSFERVCKNGDCIGSICEKIGWSDCSKASNGDNLEELCFVSCQKPNGTDCISSNDQAALDANPNFKALLQEIADGKNQPDNLSIKKLPGSSCNFKKGYCDVLSKCRLINAEGPFKQLTDLIFNPMNFQKVGNWIKDHWWAVLLMALGGILFMVLFVKIFGYNTPSEDPKKKKRNADRQNAAAAGARSRGQGDKRSRPPERAAAYTTDHHSANYGQTNFGYEGGQDAHRRPQQPPPAYPNYAGPHSQQGRAPNRQHFDRISVPQRY